MALLYTGEDSLAVSGPARMNGKFGMLGEWHSLSLSWDAGLVEKCCALPEWTVEFTPHNKGRGEKVQLAL